MNRLPRLIIGSMAMAALFLVFPGYGSPVSSSLVTMLLVLAAAAGMLLSKTFVLSSHREDQSGAEPSIIMCIVSWGLPMVIYPVVVAFTFAGSLINAVRTENSLREIIPEALFQGFSFALLLRMGSFFYMGFLARWPSEDGVVTYIALMTGAILVSAIRTLSVRFADKKSESFGHLFRRSIFANGFLLLLAVPSAVTARTSPESREMVFCAIFSIFSILMVYGISLKLDRASHERTREMETVRELSSLSGSLFQAETEMKVLRILVSSVSAAWHCRSAVAWKNLKLYSEEPWNTDSAPVAIHPRGLSIWLDSYSSTVPEYLESFQSRAVPVLLAIEAERRMKRASWKSMETMVAFFEDSKSDFAGLSRRVAETAQKLSRELEMAQWFCDCMRLAGLLHMTVDETDNESNGAYSPMPLPETTAEALRTWREHWCGTGPGGLEGDSIPLSGRILSVCIGWERAASSGTETALRDLRMRSGALYDPDLVRVLAGLKE
jgi:HD-GYP domain-containing protein (c-di-GMP phosphodiesterase class II)/uncharacterized protein (DUF486 family)